MLQRPVLSHGPSVHIPFPDCTSSLGIHPICQRNNSCVSLQLWRFSYWWIFWLKSSAPLPVFKKRAIRREGLCFASWGFTNFYKQLKMEAFNRKDRPALSGSIALWKSPHKLGGTQPWSCPVHVPPLLSALLISCHALPANTPWNYAAVTFHQIQHLRGKNEEMAPKTWFKISQHFQSPGILPHGSFICGTSHPAWYCTDPSEMSMQRKTREIPSKNHQMLLYSPKAKSLQKKIITFTLPISSFQHFVGFVASWTHAQTRYGD